MSQYKTLADSKSTYFKVSEVENHLNLLEIAVTECDSREVVDNLYKALFTIDNLEYHRKIDYETSNILRDRLVTAFVEFGNKCECMQT